jgi:hypothetical protein
MMSGLLFKSVTQQSMRGLTYSRRRYFGDDPQYPGLPASPGSSRKAASRIVRLLRFFHG